MEREFETREVEISPEQFEAGDYMLSTGLKVKRDTLIKIGTKWVYVSNKDGSEKHQFPRNQKVAVFRQFETEASKERRFRDDLNERIRRAVEEWWKPSRDEAMEQLRMKTEQWGSIQSHDLDRLLRADADDKVWRNFISMVTHTLEQEGNTKDYVDIRNEYIAHLKDELASYTLARALSRSTSVTDNLLTDVRREAISDFIERRHYMW